MKQHTIHHEYNYSWRCFENFGNNNEMLADQLVSNNYSIGLHSHSFFEVDVILEGNATIFLGDTSFEAKKGQVYIIEPKIKHGFISEGQFDVYHLLLRKEFFNFCPEQLVNSEGFSMLFDIKSDFYTWLPQRYLLELSDSSIKKLLTLIQISEQFKTVDREIFTLVGFTNIIAFLTVEMFNHYNCSLPGSSTDVANDIVRAVQYMNVHYSEKIALETLADIANMSRSTFSRHFTKFCGCAPFQYLKAIRLKKFDEAIAKGMTKTEAAHACGFYDVAHVIKAKEKNTNSAACSDE